MKANHVLLVEDDFIVNHELREYIEDYGFKVEAVYSGEAGLAAIQRNSPWALVTDLDLGPGPDGFVVARFARAVDPDMPVIYISGDIRGRYPRDGVSRSTFLTKPVTGGQIVAALRWPTPLAAA